MNNPFASIAPTLLGRAIAHQRSEIPDDGEVLERLYRYLETTRPMLADIAAAVCEFYHIRHYELTGSYREFETTLARQVFCYLAHRYARASSLKIGRFIGRDHSTVLHAIRVVEKWMVSRPLLLDDIDLLRLRISEKMLERRATRC